ncbi:ABC transporter ATP-binding protein [Sedimentibacter hydroxybenzoicus DSM 7310]|uniref:ABC transporter ATP-binding protein n=1 Tax=Sedimentibacter hydroxybenzoicus DSM 7310 TaxID=1123245 RepID=A0A974BLZ8_SEDHY|nr:ABC transporter ATP-binding protein [Sedimentibacter hydroxybenzoicus]NYB75035.1 ABC transporter ATP-binding protein [Sedimentibacter hydroxybenzoicus DSM 7310]
MIEIKDLSKKFNNFTAVNNIDLVIKSGEFMGVLGPNGAGKTTTIKIITGLLKPTAGNVYINGSLMNRNNKEIKGIMGIVPQYSNLDKELTVYENLVFAAKLFRVENYRNKIDELLDFVELSDFKDRMTGNLSGGMARRLTIAKALINDPDIIILDEPTVGIDINGRRKIWDILKYLKSRNKTVLLTTHYIEEAEYLCSRVCLIDKGVIIQDSTPENLKEQLGAYTVEYFDAELKTAYKFFDSKQKALDYSAGIKSSNYTVRETTLEDVFYNYTNRKVV